LTCIAFRSKQEKHRISREEAVEIARERALQNDWPFQEPVHVSLETYQKGACYWIMTNAMMKGGNANFRIDATTGEIIGQGFPPR
jgi:uncharacterized membrane protein YkoI